jgi:hypothetical protein
MIDGKGPYWFLLDTGASRSALDDDVARDLRLVPAQATSVQGSAGTIEVQAVHLPQLELGETRVRGLEPTVYDLSGSLAPEGQTITGILGHDAMKDHAVLFDTARGRVVFAPVASQLAELADAAVIPFTLDNNIPLLPARINGLEVRLRLDTGASLGTADATYVNVTESVYERLKEADPTLTPTHYFTASGTGGTIRIPVVPAQTFELGERSFDRPFLIVQPRTGYFANENAVGFIGAYVLQGTGGFIVDYPARRLIILP